jgi:hypothetical protein
MKNKSILGPVLIILIILKIFGVINWSWSIVLIPLWIAIIVVFAGNIIKRNRNSNNN